jgi:hypothetical protein
VRPAADLLEEAAVWVRAEHPHPLHLERTLYWLDELVPGARPELRLTALLHDIERADPDADAPFDSARDWNRDAYVSYHQGRCAQHLTRWMGVRDADPAAIEVCAGLVAVHERGGWPDADLLQAADSLSFVETMLPLIDSWISSGRATREGALAKLEFMWTRMQVPRAFEIGSELHEAALRGRA